MVAEFLDLGREVRISSGFEVRSLNADGPIVELNGYASVTGHPYDVAGGPDLGGWVETIAPGAFARTLGRADQNRALLFHHDGSRVLATTRSNTLTMTEDSVGLLVRAELDTSVTWIGDLVRQMEAGTIDEMSIGFYDTTGPGGWSKDYTHRTISEVRLVEATVTWAGANPATVAAIERTRDAVAAVRSAHPALSVDRVRLAAAAALARR